MENKSYRGDKGMSKQTSITEWLMNCPELASLYNISAEEQDGANIIFPIGSSTRRSISDTVDVTGGYEANIMPSASVYEEYQINCYKYLANSDNAYNVMRIEEAEAVIDWINEQDEKQSFPDMNGKKVVAVETLPFVPQIRFADPETGIVCYYITLRITYVNTAVGRSVYYG